jgi:CRISPR type III-A/MTUBE-associated protein Csm6
MDDILFTCAGTSDPVRGNRDGGILHIMRYYHPKRVYLFLSQQIADLEAQDHRFEKTFQHMQEVCAAQGIVYQPSLFMHNSQLCDASKIDLVEKPLLEYFTSVAAENPNCRILLNLSSGTPQMKTLMQFLAVDSPYHVLGVQVDGPQQNKKDQSRTDNETYNVDYELATNFDDEPDCLPEGERRNRTSEPEMFAIKHQRHRHQLLKLLERQDYDAMLDMSQNLPRQLRTLLQHLNARNNLQSEEAYKLSKELTDLGFPLYPAMKSDSHYRDLSEYYLLLRNLQKLGRYSEFVLRLNPFLTELLYTLLTQTEFAGYLKKNNGRIDVATDVLNSKQPELMKRLQAEAQRTLLDYKNFSIFLGISMLLVTDTLSDAHRNFLRACNALNTAQRNTAAHQLHAVLEEDIKHDCFFGIKHYGSAEIVQKLGELLAQAYPDVCDKSLFRIYDRCNDYIKAHLQLGAANL